MIRTRGLFTRALPRDFYRYCRRPKDAVPDRRNSNTAPGDFPSEGPVDPVKNRMATIDRGGYLSIAKNLILILRWRGPRNRSPVKFS